MNLMNENAYFHFIISAILITSFANDSSDEEKETIDKYEFKWSSIFKYINEYKKVYFHKFFILFLY